MNHIEEKTRYELDAEHTDRRYNSVLYLTNRQVSWLTASIVLCSFFIFIAGYFLGQRKAIDQFNEAIDKDALADSAYAQLYMHSESLENSGSSQVEPVESVAQPEPKQHYAQLIGFGTSRAADRFIDRLQQKNIPVKVVERHSKTAQGKEIIWYQVVTDRFSKKDDLVAFTQKIKNEERLNDIRIVSC